MKISYQWLRDYIKADISVEKIGEILTSIGLEVEAIEEVETIKGGLKGVVVGEVLTCEKHPDADRLKVTTVNLGGESPSQIVCGAPNVAAGQKVLVATVGSTLYPNGGEESLVIKKSKIRGVESLGMICAEDELGLGKSHDGILILDNDAIPGTPAAEFLNVKSDFCLEIGLTPNRTDAFSHFGVARDLYAALRNMHGLEKIDATLIQPNVHSVSGKGENKVNVMAPDGAPRYAGVLLDNVKVGPSPDWLANRLTTIGLRPINNVVDITNYVQHELGQPLHAFDADKIAGNQVVVRYALEGEKFVTLDSVERELHPEDLMICDAEKPMCIAGVFGGAASGVSDETTRVFIESAYFNPVVVRKTARRHGLHTDASFRFERGVDPQITMHALYRCVSLLKECAGANVASEVVDVYPEKIAPVSVTLSLTYANQLIGQVIPKETVRSILQDLEIEVVSDNGDELNLTVPNYRADVIRPADVVEEILRIYGFNNIDFPKGLKASMSAAPKPDAEKITNAIADYLVSRGFHEMMGMSLTKTKYTGYSQEMTLNDTTSVALLNPLSQDLGVMRQSLLWGGLESIEYNRNHKNPDLKLFEFGKVYHKGEGKYQERYVLALFLTGRAQPESWNNSSSEVSFYDLKANVEGILNSLGISEHQVNAANTDIFSDGLSFSSRNKIIARLGFVKDTLLKKFDIKSNVLYAELEWELLLSMLPKNSIQYKPTDKFPRVRRDLSLLLNKSVSFQEIEKVSFETEKKLLREVGLFDVYEGKNLEEGKKSYAISFVLQDSTKTMTDQQVEGIMSKLTTALDEKLGAKVRS